MSEKKRETRPWDFFKKDVEFAAKHIVKQRMDICNNCPFYFKLTKQCKICMCIMPAKTILADASCPKGKWLETTEYEQEE